MHLKSVLAGTVAAVALLASGAPSADATEELVFAISASTGSLQQRTAAEFTKRANERLGDLAQIELFDNSQLGKDQDLLQKLKLGSVHLSMPSSIMSSVADEYALFDMPFLVEDREHLARIQEAVFADRLGPAAEAAGYKILGVWENGVRHITNNVRPIDTPADLDGLKIRTPRSTWRVTMFETWGANPTPMAFAEVFVALQTGVIDGQENPLTNIEAAKFDEVQEYLSLTGHVYSPSYLATGKNVFEGLDPEIQEILMETAVEMEQWARAEGAAADDDLLAELEDRGMEVNRADRAAFVEASKPIYDAFAAEVEGGAEMIEAAHAAAATD